MYEHGLLHTTMQFYFETIASCFMSQKKSYGQGEIVKGVEIKWSQEGGLIAIDEHYFLLNE